MILGNRSILTPSDEELILSLAGCSLDEHKGSNWVQDNGGLPEYICRIARAIKRSGKTTSAAISIAVSRVKMWAATGKPDTKAKAAAAVAEWEALKAKAHVKHAAKGAKSDKKSESDTVKASVENLEKLALLLSK